MEHSVSLASLLYYRLIWTVEKSSPKTLFVISLQCVFFFKLKLFLPSISYKRTPKDHQSTLLSLKVVYVVSFYNARPKTNVTTAIGWRLESVIYTSPNTISHPKLRSRLVHLKNISQYGHLLLRSHTCKLGCCLPERSHKINFTL